VTLFYSKSEEVRYLLFRRVVKMEDQWQVFSVETVKGEHSKVQHYSNKQRLKKAGLLELRFKQ